MSLNFNRSRVQLELERLIGIGHIDKKDDKAKIASFSIPLSSESALQNYLIEDSKDFFYNGLISFIEGLNAVRQKNFSWATIKLYYSVFYFLRATLAFDNIALFRYSSMYRIELKYNQKLFNTNNKKYNSTHGGTISHYIDLYLNRDILLSNPIDGMNSYEWFQEMREIINYRAVAFYEPDYLSIWEKFSNTDDLLIVLDNILQDDNKYILCFQEEYAIVSLAIIKLQETIKKFRNIECIDRQQHLKRLQDTGLQLFYDKLINSTLNI